MTLARLLAAALLFCCLNALSQDSPKGNRATSDAFGVPALVAAATPSEPWRIIPDQTASTGSEINVTDRFADEYVLQVNPDGRSSILKQSDINGFPTPQPPEKSGSNDEVCYAIHSYVVARDSKESDSTHPVSSSTCRPASRYHVKSAEARHAAPER